MISDTTYLLKECNAGCRMATNSLEQVIPHVEDQKLCDLLHKYDLKHREIKEGCDVLLGKIGEEKNEPHPLARAFAWMGTEMKLSFRDDGSAVAGMMMDGCSMGIKSLSRYLNQYSEASQESRDLARKLIRMEEDFLVELGHYI